MSCRCHKDGRPWKSVLREARGGDPFPLFPRVEKIIDQLDSVFAHEGFRVKLNAEYGAIPVTYAHVNPFRGCGNGNDFFGTDFDAQGVIPGDPKR